MNKKTKYSLEDEISRTILAENGCTVHFECADDTSEKGEATKRRVTAFTFNPKTQATFLLKEVVAQSDEDGLQEILNYVNRHKEDYSSFTVRWAKKDGDGIQVSNFYCVDLLEALEKFYYNKKREDYIVYETKMNPIA